MKKITAAALALLMLLAAVSCAGNSGDAPSGETTASGATESTAAETEGETGISYDEYYPKGNFDGYSFRMVDEGADSWCLDTLFAETMTGEALNDAIYERNNKTAERLNVKISYEAISNLSALVKQAASAGDDVADFVWTDVANEATWAQSGYLYNLKKINALQTDMPWWDRNAVDALNYKDKLLYFAETDINIQNIEATWVLYFNKQIIEQYSLETPYDLVRAGTWTMDKMYEYMLAVSGDVNGDGILSAPEDMFGFATHSASYTGLLAAAGQTLVTRGSDYTYINNLPNEALYNAAVKINKIMTAPDATVLPNKFKGASETNNEWAINSFYSGRCLFYGEVIGKFADLRNMENDFGLIPYPKYDETQDKYYCLSLSSAEAMCIPIHIPDPERTGAVIESLSIDSMLTLKPTYYDVTVTGKSMRDEDSREMLEIISAGCVYDLGIIYNWGNLPNSFTTCVTGIDAYMSTAEKSSKVFDKTLSKTIDAFEAEIAAME